MVQTKRSFRGGGGEGRVDLHDAVLVLTDGGAACVLDVRPVAIVKLHGIGDHFGKNTMSACCYS